LETLDQKLRKHRKHWKHWKLKIGNIGNIGDTVNHNEFRKNKKNSLLGNNYFCLLLRFVLESIILFICFKTSFQSILLIF